MKISSGVGWRATAPLRIGSALCYGDGLETRYITVVLLVKIVPLKQREAIEEYGLST